MNEAEPSKTNALSSGRPDHDRLKAANEAGGLTKLRTYVSLSGPGYLQSAITLGGGSLAGSLYLGVLAGPGMLWVQPLAMLFGIIMLSAIAYVTLATGRRPFEAINTEVNPVFGWGWALAAFVANMVWVMPQYALAVGVFQQNLLPGVFGEDGLLPHVVSNLILVSAIFAGALWVTWSYGKPGPGVRLFELLLKLMVAFIVLAFVGVVFRLAIEPGALNWREIFSGFIPNPGMLTRPADGFEVILAHLPSEFAGYWREIIVGDQRGVVVTTAATAVGINMTFIFGYSLLRRRWTREFRGFVKFDLATGMLIPFLVATSCVVVAAASQFHGVPQHGLMEAEEIAEVRREIGQDERAHPTGDRQASARQRADYQALLLERALLAKNDRDAATVLEELGALAGDDRDDRIAELIGGTTRYDRYLAATLVHRNSFDLANALEPLLGWAFSQIVFGLGVFGMTFSSIVMLMVISGIGFCEFFHKPHEGKWFRIGSLFPVTGLLGAFFWAGQPWLVVPTSVFAFLLIPLAYISFFALMNQKRLLGVDMPTGRRRVAWNLLMGVALLIIVPSSLFVLHDRYGWSGMMVAAGFVVFAGAVHLLRARRG